MKKTCFILIMIMAVCVSKAQTTLSRYDIRYSTEHHVLTKDGYVNVVDIDLEWPDVVEFGKAEKLQKALCDSLFRNFNRDMLASKQHYLDSLGCEVTKLDTIPDDDSFNYYTLSLKEMGLRQGRFISFLATFECNPGKKKGGSNVVADYCITYDVNNDVVLNERDLLDVEYVFGTVDNRFSNYIYALLSRGSVSNIIGPIPVTENNMSFKIYKEDGSNNIIYVDNDYVGHLRRPYKKLLKADHKVKTVVLNTLSDASGLMNDADKVDTTLLYRKVDEQPVFELNGETLPQYMAANLDMPKEVKVEKPLKRAMVSFVVERDGSLSNFHIIQPSSPMVDRSIIELLKSMPRWKPGKIKNQIVRSVCIVPVTVQI